MRRPCISLRVSRGFCFRMSFRVKHVRDVTNKPRPEADASCEAMDENYGWSRTDFDGVDGVFTDLNFELFYRRSNSCSKI